MTDDDIRAEVRDWLAANWSRDKAKDDHAVRWTRRVFEARWAATSWPAEWFGRGYTNAQAKIVEQAFAAVGARGAGQDRSNLAANTVLKFGTEALKHVVLPKLLSGEASICLLYSEPGAGSDLASVRTRADRQGDGWVVNGQKVWTSGAMTADYGLLLARTDWDQPKHNGISFFLLPMKQAGVDVRPIHQITGDRHFNEVFIDNAIVPPDHRLGEENAGWSVLQTALAYERLIMGEGAGERRQGASKDNRVDLVRLAHERGKLRDPVLRQKIAQAIAYRHLNSLNLARAKAEMAQGTSSPIMSLGKLAMSRILHNDARVMGDILGTESLLDGPDHALAADVNYRGFNAFMTSIGGGTDQIQRNIISERVLGLPREIEIDRNLPFRESRAVTG